MLAISKTIIIPARELSFRFTKSSKPGGQNVNKVNTRVTLVFDLFNSPSLSPEEKERISRCLATRVSKKGQLQVTCYRHRTQGANRSAVVERFTALLQEALRTRKPRKKTRTSKAAVERRLEAKKQRSRLKEARKGRTDW